MLLSIRSKHCGANEGKQIVFLAEGCRPEGYKSVPSLFAIEHLGTGLIMGESTCSYEYWPASLWMCYWAAQLKFSAQQG